MIIFYVFWGEESDFRIHFYPSCLVFAQKKHPKLATIPKKTQFSVKMKKNHISREWNIAIGC